MVMLTGMGCIFEPVCAWTVMLVVPVATSVNALDVDAKLLASPLYVAVIMVAPSVPKLSCTGTDPLTSVYGPYCALLTDSWTVPVTGFVELTVTVKVFEEPAATFGVAVDTVVVVVAFCGGGGGV